MAHDIKTLLGVLFLGVLSAFAIGAFFVFNYGPSGKYLAKNTLISPLMVEEFDYNDMNPRTHQTDRFIFDKIEYSYPKGNSFAVVNVPVETYKIIWETLANDQSSGDKRELFHGSSKLAIKVRTESREAWQFDVKDFQRVEFAKDHYRIELHEDNPGDHWVYFERQGVGEEVKKVLAP
jgi:hypothetical protein